MFFNKNWDVTEYALLTEEERESEFKRSFYSMMSAVCGTIPELYDEEEEPSFDIPILQPECQQLPHPEPGQQLGRLKRLQPAYRQSRRESRHNKLPKRKSFAWKGRQ